MTERRRDLFDSESEQVFGFCELGNELSYFFRKVQVTLLSNFGVTVKWNLIKGFRFPTKVPVLLVRTKGTKCLFTANSNLQQLVITVAKAW
jgi:hypothetical protein